MKDIAKMAGVSPSTVSAAINNSSRISPKTRERVLKIVRELNYSPNAFAKGLRGKAMNTIGLILPSIDNPFYPAIARGVEDVAKANGYNVFLCNSDRDQNKEMEYIDSLIQKQVDGYIFAAPIVEETGILQITATGRPAVVVNKEINGDLIDEVWIDYVCGSYDLVKYLIKLGHRRIVHIQGPPGLKRSGDRLAGYLQAMKEHGLLVDNGLIRHGDFNYQSGYTQTLALFEEKGPKPTAIFAANDLMALGVVAAIQDLGFKVPDDISVAGFDDIALASYVRPKLTTVYQPNYEVGKMAMEILSARISQKKDVGKIRITMETSLVIRNSTAAPPRGRQP
ncbi:MAG TPA: LacI family DNA-binding transcriptional regulator [Bacillota bacterium]